jgi:hypothetical protein
MMGKGISEITEAIRFSKISSREKRTDPPVADRGAIKETNVMAHFIKMILAAGLVFVSGGFASAAETYPWRMWQFHAMKPDYVRRVMKEAGNYGVNAVVFSQAMIGKATEILDATDSSREGSAGEDWRPNRRGRQLQELAAEANRLGLKVIFWIHELEYVPPRFLKDGKVRFDDEGLTPWIQNKYRALFRHYPECDGIMLTFHETQYKIFDESQVQSRLSMPERFVRLIDTLDTVCRESGKTLIVREFVYEPRELAWLREGLRKASDRIIIQSKCVPHDWEPFYPHNPMIGAIPGRKMIIEFDASSEYTGRNRIPYCSPEYFLEQWRYDRQFPEVAGYNARLDHQGFDAFFTPDRINLYALSRAVEKPDAAAEEIWREWTEQTYGPQAASLVEKALRPTFDCVNKAFFARGFWYTNHSRLPGYRYAVSSLTNRSLSKWSPEDEHLKRIERLLVRPTPEFYEKILAEKEQAAALADECLLHLRAAKPHLKPEQYDDLRFRLDLLRRVTEVWRLHAEAFWGLRLLEEGNTVPGLRARVERALDALDRQAELSRQDPQVGDTPPASASIIRTVVKDLRNRLDRLEKK